MPLTMKYTDIRTVITNGKPMIGLQIVARDAAGAAHKTLWADMTPEDAARLMDKLREVLHGTEPASG